MHKKYFALRLVLVLAMLGLPLLFSSPAQAASHGPYQLIGWDSHRCIDNPNSSTSNGTVMMIYTCDNALPIKTNQQWRYDDTDSGYFQIRNVHSGKCLTVKGASTANNAAVIQYACNLGDNEEWKVQARYQDGRSPYHWYSTLVSRKSGKCLTVKGASIENKAPLLQYTCNSGGNQYWDAAQLP